MRDIASDILKRFSDVLRTRSVPSGLHSYYLKWLRYYLDYCFKYHLPDNSSKSLQQFLRKLLEKKQTEGQRKQAGHAVSLYLDMGQASRVQASAAQEPAKKSVIKKAADPVESSLDMRQSFTFKQYAASGAAKTQWARAISEMTATIKTKHYSPQEIWDVSLN